MVKLKFKIVKRGDLYYIKKSNNKFATWKDFDINTAFPTTPAVYQTKSQAVKDLKRLELVKNLCKFCRKNEKYKHNDVCLSCLKAMEFERDMSRPTR